MAWTATGGNLKGPKGDPGTNGAKGDAGTSLHVANITVSSNSDVATSVLSPSAPMTVGDLISDTNGTCSRSLPSSTTRPSTCPT